MTTSYNPSVVTNGLIMYLDAANSKSYNPNLTTNTSAFNYAFNNQSGANINDTAPDNTIVACKHDLTGASSPYMNVRADRLLAPGTYTMSAYIKGTTSFSASFAFVGETNNEIYANTASVTTQWQRFTLTFTLLATSTSNRLQIFFGTQGNNIILSVWGAELVYGSAPTNKYIDSALRGNNWIDLTGNGYNATVSNTAFISTEGGGVFETQGANGSNIIQSTLNLSSSNYTIITAARYSGASRGRMVNGYYNNWILGHWGGTTENYYAQGWISSVGAGASDTNWRLYTGTGQISAVAYSLYLNGNKTISNNSAGTVGPNGIMIGEYGQNPITEQSIGRCSFLMAYNRVLSDAEVQQNFNALRGRFNL